MNFIIKCQHAPDGVIIKYGDMVSGQKLVVKYNMTLKEIAFILLKNTTEWL